MVRRRRRIQREEREEAERIKLEAWQRTKDIRDERRAATQAASDLGIPVILYSAMKLIDRCSTLEEKP